ncbi:MAG: protein kinase [Planctomycetia bacterium]|nr:protein kinase [Planctomycetia bacterium]
MPALKSSEPILGYQVTERIGAGGYGEVWKATAPGGLNKAIKFIYGYLDDERAKRELKALSRVKQVRHPFLLSLERIEIVDGQLVIVTELADMSLKDRHHECKAAGNVGIPRDELLGYLRDAADALDYMREKYSLQHLDVKPENLLLVGGHVKVADFGLVKDIADTNSLMGGLTPLYASPEVFDDRPSQCSDQYSLAIVYQEMLTDTLPFPGKTAAQLAAQHLQSRPRLTALPPSDKAVVDRALSKEPEQRFASCREMVDVLLGLIRAPSGGGSAGLSGSGDTAIGAAQDTQAVRPAAFDVAERGSSSQTQSLEGLRRSDSVPRPPVPPAPTRVRQAPVVSDLEPLAAPAGPHLRPTLFVGVGGIASTTLRHLRRRLQDRFGNLQAVPAMHILLVDTDTKALYQATQGDRESALDARETLALPLKKTEEYRAGSTQLLQWMSRRWLYNIPRSLHTEGLRPLGRLAFVDHCGKLIEQLDAAIETIVDPATIATTAQTIGNMVAEASPRVFIVASIAGGTGGGMVLDLAYAVRKLLADRRLADDGLSVILLHATPRNPAARDLAIANSYACLSELHHYIEQGYPGEPASGMTTLARARVRMPTTYLVHLGEDLSESGLGKSADAVAEYMYLNTATPAANWFEAVRRAPAHPPQPPGEVALRTFGVYRLGCSRDTISQAVDFVCRALVDRWSGEDHRHRMLPAAPAPLAAGPAAISRLPDAEIDRLAQHRIKGLALSVDEVLMGLQQVARHTLGHDVETFLREAVAKMLTARANAPTGDAAGGIESILRQLDHLLGRQLPAEPVEEQSPLATAIESQLKQLAKDQAATVNAWAFELADRPGARIKGAARAVEQVALHVRGMRDTVAAMRGRVAEELQGITVALSKARPRTRAWHGLTTSGGDEELTPWLVQYGTARFMDSSLSGLLKYVQVLSWNLTSIGDQLKDARRELHALALLFEAQDASPSPSAPDEAAAAIQAQIRDSVQPRLPELVATLDEQFQGEFTRQHGGMCAALARGPEVRAALANTMRDSARAAVRTTIRAATVGEKVLANDAAPDQAHELLQSCLTHATPSLGGCGGERRLLIIASDEQDAQPLAQAVREVSGVTPSVVADAAGDPAMCYEVARMPLLNAADALIDGRPDIAQIAGRLRTRCDISWVGIDR